MKRRPASRYAPSSGGASIEGVKRPIVIATLLFLALAGISIALIGISASDATAWQCEVCVTFRGAQACREALGPTEKDATRTAQDNACGLVSSGMTQSISCANTVPDSITCNER